MSCCDDGYIDCETCGGYGHIIQADEDGELGEDLCEDCAGRGWNVCPCEG